MNPPNQISACLARARGIWCDTTSEDSAMKIVYALLIITSVMGALTLLSAWRNGLIDNRNRKKDEKIKPRR